MEATSTRPSRKGSISGTAVAVIGGSSANRSRLVRLIQRKTGIDSVCSAESVEVVTDETGEQGLDLAVFFLTGRPDRLDFESMERLTQAHPEAVLVALTDSEYPPYTETLRRHGAAYCFVTNSDMDSALETVVRLVHAREIHETTRRKERK